MGNLVYSSHALPRDISQITNNQRLMENTGFNRPNIDTPKAPPSEATVSIPLKHLNGMLECLSYGKDYAQECLSDHDVRFGRTTRKNKMTAAGMQDDIEYMEDMIKWAEAHIGVDK